jgi:hypothetical protein
MIDNRKGRHLLSDHVKIRLTAVFPTSPIGRTQGFSLLAPLLHDDVVSVAATPVDTYLGVPNGVSLPALPALLPIGFPFCPLFPKLLVTYVLSEFSVQASKASGSLEPVPAIEQYRPEGKVIPDVANGTSIFW